MSKYTLVSETLSGPADALTSKRMIFSTRKGMGVTVSNYLLQLIESGQFELIPDAMFNILLFHEIIIAADEDELEEIVKSKRLVCKPFEKTIAIGFSERATSDKIDAIRATVGKQNYDRLKVLRIELFAGQLTNVELLVEALGDALDTSVPKDTVSEISVICDTLDVATYSSLKIDQTKLKEFHFIVSEIEKSQELCAWATMFISDPQNASAKLYFDVIINGDKTEDYHTHLHAIQNVQGLHVRFGFPGHKEGGKNNELSVLKTLSALKMHFDLVPTVSRTFYDPAPEMELNEEEYASATVMSSFNFSTDAKRFFRRESYDDRIVNQLLNRNTPCSECNYLPLCGGRLDKHTTHTLDCPTNISNIMDKARLKYKLPMEIL